MRSSRLRAVAALGLLMAALAVSLRGWAAPTTAGDAATVVANFLRVHPAPLGLPLGRTGLAGVVTYTDDAGVPLYYVVYLKPSGFVIVAANDRVEPLIAFVRGGTYDASPRNPLGALVGNDLRGRLEAVRQAEALAAGAASGKFAATVTAATRKWALLSAGPGGAAAGGLDAVSDVRVDPLLHSTWGQGEVPTGECFNYYTPNHYASGCVATAMAQVMRYHRYPITGVGTTSFQVWVDGVSQNLPLRGGNGTGGVYDWASMVLVPDGTTTLAQRQAIGALVYDAGVATHMSYTASLSLTTLDDAGAALLTPFHFARSVVSTFRTEGYDFDSGEGANMVNANLDAGYPAVLGITSVEGGHAVVADGYGYESNVLYHHLNFGWDGYSDAWYDLPNMVTEYMRFTAVQQVVYNIFPSVTGEIISGRVVDSDGLPAAGVTVTAKVTAVGTFATDLSDAAGVFALTNLPPNTTFLVSADSLTESYPTQEVTTGRSQNHGTPGNVWGVEFVPGLPLLDLADVSVAENAGSASVTVRLTGISTSDITVHYATADDTATAGLDYTAASGTLTWAAGASGSQSFGVPILDDALTENSETVALAIINATNAVIRQATATLTIVDNDGPPRLAVPDSSVDENVGTAQITVTLSGQSTAEVSVDYQTSAGTATPDLDYSDTAGTLTWPALAVGDQTFSLSILDDTLADGDETVFVTLSNATNATVTQAVGTVTIVDDEAVPQLAVADLEVYEHVGTAQVVVTLTGVSDQTVSVTATTHDGTATAPDDYTTTTGTLSWLPETSGDQTFGVPVIDDVARETTETFSVVLTGAVNAEISYATGTVSIVDNDYVAYVDQRATGKNDGTSWTDAYTDLQSALATTEVASEVWVATGLYLPASTRDRNATFALRTDLRLYGGFAGTEHELVERDWQAWPTILSGDLGTRNDVSDNCYRVVTGAAGATLDGVVVTGGNANGSLPRNAGGGMFNAAVTITVRNCIFTGNAADEGGAVYNLGGTPQFSNCRFVGNRATYVGGGAVSSRTAPTVFTNCLFAGNTATGNGGAILNNGASLSATNCVLTDNVASEQGGALYNLQSSPTLINCTFSGNSATTGGAVASGVGCTPYLTNCILWDDLPGEITGPTGVTAHVNYSCVAGGFAGLGNLSTDPLFLPRGAGWPRLEDASPCVDAGDSTVAPTADVEDLARWDSPAVPDRGVGSTTYVDLGAYERQAAMVTIGDVTVSENDGTATVSVSLSGTTTDPVTVDYATMAYTATAGTDYWDVDGTLTWAAGDEGTQTFTVLLVNDAVAEDTELVRLVLSNATNAVITGGEALLTILDDDHVPVAADDTYTTVVNVALVLAAPGLLGNDTDADGDALLVSYASRPRHGTLVWAADGSLTYTPATDFVGTDSFIYLATDGANASNAATVTITVVPGNHAPTALADAAETAEEGEVVVNVLDNDVDSDGDSLTVSAVGRPGHGVATTVNSGRLVRYRPASGFAGTDTFTYTVSDGRGGTATATVTVTVTPPVVIYRVTRTLTSTAGVRTSRDYLLVGELLAHDVVSYALLERKASGHYQDVSAELDRAWSANAQAYQVLGLADDAAGILSARVALGQRQLTKLGGGVSRRIARTLTGPAFKVDREGGTAATGTVACRWDDKLTVNANLRALSAAAVTAELLAD